MQEAEGDVEVLAEVLAEAQQGQRADLGIVEHVGGGALQEAHAVVVEAEAVRSRRAPG